MLKLRSKPKVLRATKFGVLILFQIFGI